MQCNGKTLKVECNVGIALAERVARIAPVVAAVLLGRIDNLQGQDEGILSGSSAAHPDPRTVGDDFIALEPGDFRVGIRLEQALHNQLVTFLLNRRFFREAWRLAFWDSIFASGY